MEAPIGGSGRYRTAQIVEALTTVYSGFLAAIEGVSHGAKRPGRSTGAIDVVVIYSSPVW